MSEQYNHIFVWRGKLSGEMLSHVFADDLSPVWEVLGQPADLLTLNVEKGVEESTDVSERIDLNLLQCPPGTILSIRGTESQMGTVQYYELGNFGVVSVSRPFRLLAPQQRLEWMNLLWSRLEPKRAILAASGREMELEASDIEAGTNDWSSLLTVPLIELLVLSRRLVSATPREATPVRNGWLIRVQSDATGGGAAH